MSGVVDAIRERAARQPAHAALRVDDGVGGALCVSYAELVECADAHAARLRADGVAPGERCGLVAPQGRAFVELALGILAADACLVPIPEDHRHVGGDLHLDAAREELTRQQRGNLLRQVAERDGFRRVDDPPDAGEFEQVAE